mmetsp:Transcript_72313/g.169323  ORF Transcript_72313/g.169323 Transcript_72313/m.169323 type:complete len:229 (-) Transcript_72313:503-1189(-)
MAETCACRPVGGSTPRGSMPRGLWRTGVSMQALAGRPTGGPAMVGGAGSGVKAGGGVARPGEGSREAFSLPARRFRRLRLSLSPPRGSGGLPFLKTETELPARSELPAARLGARSSKDFGFSTQCISPAKAVCFKPFAKALRSHAVCIRWKASSTLPYTSSMMRLRRAGLPEMVLALNPFSSDHSLKLRYPEACLPGISCRKRNNIFRSAFGAILLNPACVQVFWNAS